MKNLLHRYLHVCLLALAAMTLAAHDSQAAEADCTSQIQNAACSNISGWKVASGGANGTLQIDTWSTRGSKDGSGMTTPFAELIVDKGRRTPLDDATIAHTTVTNLLPGTYRLTIKVRCYNEWDTSGLADLVGAYVNVLSDGQKHTVEVTDDPDAKGYYSNQLFEAKDVSIDFHVGADWQFDFNVETRGANFNWISWKNVTLTRLAIDPTINPLALDRAQRTILLMSGEYPDATFLITNPNMNDNSGWSGGTIGGNASNRCMEVWNTNSFDISQKLTDIPNGTYHLSVQGYYRYNTQWGNTNYTPYDYQVQQQYAYNRYAQQLYAQLYANNVQAPIMSIADEYEQTSQMFGTNGEAYGMPFSMDQASACFTAGLYSTNDHGNNHLDVTVTDHTLTIGVRKTRQSGCDWTVWDNFQLTLVSLGDNTGYTPMPQYDIDFSRASWDEPLDVTSLVANPNYDEGNSKWTGSYSTGGSSSNRVAERYYANFNVHQTITGVPNGHYRLSAQGYYRYGDIGYQQEYSYDYNNQECVANKVYAMYTTPFAVTARQQGLERIYAQLYANDYWTPFHSIFDEYYDSNVHQDDRETPLGFVPHTMAAAGRAFNNGDYTMTLEFPVTNRTIDLGVRKNGGYKNDWAVWDNFRLEYLGEDSITYATEIRVPERLSMTPGQELRLQASVLPEDATDTGVVWTTSDAGLLSVQDGIAKARGTGHVTLTATARGSQFHGATATVEVDITSTAATETNLVINEIQVANVDQFIDPSKNYGGWIELYNPTDQGVTLSGLRISVDGQTQYPITAGAVPAHGYGLVWFDHHSALSSQIDTKLDMDGGTVSLLNAGGQVLATATYPPAVSRTSYARIDDGAGSWGTTAYPTPGASNRLSPEILASTALRLAEPDVSEESQLFTSPFTLTVPIPEGATLYYTTDGSTPSITASAAEEPTIGEGGQPLIGEDGQPIIGEDGQPTASDGTSLAIPTLLTQKTGTHVSTDGRFDIDATTILRLRLAAPGMLPSPVRTLSYIFRDKEYMLPVLSVVGDPDVFYNDTIGVLVPGVSGVSGSGIDYALNWNMDWERPVAFNYMTARGDTVYSQEVDMERCGGWSRSWFPYSYKLKASSQYEGLNYLAYPFFADHKPHLKHKVLQIRNGGNDLLCRIKDASLTRLITSCGWYVDCQDYTSVHNFVNGRYQGMLNMREPNNKHFAYTNYGIDTDEMDAMEITGGVAVKEGTADKFWQLHDLSSRSGDPAVYEQICKLLDVDEFANYMAAQIYLGGDDWPGNNCKGFRSKADGRFHIVFFDVDQALRYDAHAFDHVGNSGAPLMVIFKNLIRYNEGFRRQFIDAFSIAAGSVFEPERVRTIITRMAQEMEPALALEGLEPWSTANNTIRVLASTDRQWTMMNGLPGFRYINIGTRMQALSLESNQSEARFTLNGQGIPTARFNGYVYPPCTIEAKAPMGYRFAGWADAEGDIVATDSALCLDEMGDMALTAIFQPLTDAQMIAASAMPIKVNEVGAANSVYVNEYFKKNDWIELYNTTDTELDVAGLYLSDDIDQPMKYQIPASVVVNTRIPAHGYLTVWADGLVPVSQNHASFKLSNTDGSMAIVSSSNVFVANNADFFAAHPEMMSFADGMTYPAATGEQSVGRYPDGGREFFLMNRPTIDYPNVHLLTDVPAGIDEGIMDDISTFSLDLAKGWNWMSHPLAKKVPVSTFADHAQQILGQTTEVYNDEVLGLTGTLKSLSAAQLYKADMDASARYDLFGEFYDSQKPIEIRKGWNWIGYTLTGAQSVGEALADYKPAGSDVIMSQNGTAMYNTRLGRWTGTLTTLEPGVGYLLKAMGDGTLTFRDPGAVRIRYRQSRRGGSASRVAARSEYPDVMTIVGTIEVDGQPVAPDGYTIRAYSEGELRGVGQTVDSLVFLTIYGRKSEPLTFTLSSDEGDEAELDNRLTFVEDVVGTLDQPYRFALIDEETRPVIAVSADEAGSVRAVQYFNLQGQQLSSPTPGSIYLERVIFENGRVVTRKVR